QAERPEHVCREGTLEILAIGVGEERERRRPQVRRVVDEDVKPAETSDDLHGNGVDVLLLRNVADDAVCAAMLACHSLDALAVASDKGEVRSATEQLAHEGKPQPRRTAGDGDPQARKASVRIV